MALFSATLIPFKSKILHNAVSRGCCIFAVLVVEIFFVKFIVEKFGPDVFGIVVLSSNVVSLATVLSIATVTTLGRFVADEYHKGELLKASVAYSSGFGLILVSCIGLSLVFITVYALFGTIFNVEPDMLEGARNLFAGTALSFVTTMISGGFTVGMYVSNRLDLTDKLNLVRTLLSRGIAVALISLGFGFQSVGFGLAISALSVSFLFCFVSRKTIPGVRILAQHFSWDQFILMARFGFWVCMRQIGSSVLGYSDVLFANLTLSLTNAGHYAMAIFFAMKFRLVAGAFSSLFSPVLSYKYARSDIQGIFQYLRRTLKWIGIAVGLPTGLLCASYPEVLQMWFGISIPSASVIAAVSTVHIGATVSSYVILAALTASGDVVFQCKLTAVAAFIFSASALAFGSMHLDKYGYTIAFPLVLVMLVSYVFILPIYCERTFKFPRFSFVVPLVIGILCTIFASSVMFIFKWMFGCGSFLQLLIPAASTSVVYVLLCFLFFVSEDERRSLLCYVKSTHLFTE